MESFFTKKWSGIFFVFISYFLCLWFGLLVFLFTKDLHILLRLLLADIAGTVFIFIMSGVLDNTSLYDPYWSVQPIIIALGLMIYYQSYSLNAIIMVVCIAMWGVRLTGHWIKTFTNLSWQDWRYLQLKEKTKKWYPLVSFLGIQLMPTILVFLGCLPLIYYLKDLHMKTINVFTLLAYFFMVGAVILEFVSDAQMNQFLKKRTNNQEIINTGLWKYSRHPNYLGEISFWIGLYFVVLSIDIVYWWTGIGAVLIVLLFVFVSIPMIEKKFLKTKPEYISYQKRTSMLLILPLKKEIK